jgi:hypothetical protein
MFGSTKSTMGRMSVFGWTIGWKINPCPILYELCANQKVPVFEVASEDWVIHFKTRLQGIVRGQWYDLAVKLNNVVLNDEKDVPLWRWTASKKFTVK